MIDSEFVRQTLRLLEAVLASPRDKRETIAKWWRECERTQALSLEERHAALLQFSLYNALVSDPAAPAAVSDHPRCQVFLSYSGSRQVAAEEIFDGLEQRGCRCWMAGRNIPASRPFGPEICDAIRGCCAAVVICSQEVDDSDWIVREVDYILRLRKPGVIFVLDEPNEYLVFALGNRQWIDARTHPPLEPHIDKLAKDLRDSICPLLSTPKHTPRPAPRRQSAPRPT